MEIPQALTFDDVMLVPAASSVLPGDTDTRTRMNQLLTQGTVQRGYLGMQLANTFEPSDAIKLGLDRVQGALVEKIYPETPAASAAESIGPRTR